MLMIMMGKWSWSRGWSSWMGFCCFGQCLELREPMTLPANQAPNFMAGLLLFTEIFEMLNPPESCKLPGQEQCQTLRNAAGAAPKQRIQLLQEKTPFKLAKKLPGRHPKGTEINWMRQTWSQVKATPAQILLL